jgi:hypothetical protein
MRAAISLVGACCLMTLAAARATAAEPTFTDEFPLEDCEFVPFGGNAFCDLTPGRQLYLFIVGSRYYQEIARGVALDRAEHVAFDLEITTAAGHFDDCIKVVETSPLEPGHESIKHYCPHLGMVADGELRLQAVYEPRSK